MEEQLIKAFDAIHMDEACEAAVRHAMSKKKSRRSPARYALRTAVAVCLALILLVALNPTAAKAVEEIMESVKAAFPWKAGTVVLGEVITHYSDEQMELTQGPAGSTATVRTDTPSWLKEKDGRVYFLANLSNIDITDLFSAEEPFLYIYEKDGITHYIAVGGDYDPQVGLDSLGYGEWLRRTDKMEEGMETGDSHAGWIGGNSRIEYLDEEGTQYAIWLARAIVELDIPWGYTAAKQQLDALATTE